ADRANGRQGLLVFAQRQDAVVDALCRDRARGKAQRRGVPLRQDRPRPLHLSRRRRLVVGPGCAGGACCLRRRPLFASKLDKSPHRRHTETPPMAASAKLPPHAFRLATYAELDAYVHAFAAGHLHLLMLFDPPGVGKSRRIRQALDQHVCCISGRARPVGIYLEAADLGHQPRVSEDLDGVYADGSGIRLLKALCQTEPRKILSWHTATPILKRRRVPTQFTTTSPVALVGNDWKTLNADVAALEDRGHLVLFEPNALEVHRQAAAWFWDQEIFDFVADRLYLISQHSLRTYPHA